MTCSEPAAWRKLGVVKVENCSTMNEPLFSVTGSPIAAVPEVVAVTLSLMRTLPPTAFTSRPADRAGVGTGVKGA